MTPDSAAVIQVVSKEEGDRREDSRVPEGIQVLEVRLADTWQAQLPEQALRSHLAAGMVNGQ